MQINFVRYVYVPFPFISSELFHCNVKGMLLPNVLGSLLTRLKPKFPAMLFSVKYVIADNNARITNAKIKLETVLTCCCNTEILPTLALKTGMFSQGAKMNGMKV